LALARSDVWNPEGWRQEAACQDHDTDLFFPAGDTGPAALQIVRAKAICGICPVKDECLSFALTFYQEYGIWGGTTEDERRVIRRRWRAERRRASAGS
jgi:WhiB family redox-sensing transcriptional regulator